MTLQVTMGSSILRLLFTLLMCSMCVCSVSAEPLLLTEDRKADITEKFVQKTDDWRYFIGRVNNSFGKPPYNVGPFTAASALAYQITGEKRYFDNAIRLFNTIYQTQQPIGWKAYKDRNGFRTGGRWAFLAYDWLKDDLDQESRLLIEGSFAIWAEYWLEYIDYKNDFKKLRVSDSDDVTSLAENLLLMGYILQYSTQHNQLGNETLLAADKLLNEVVVERYMNNLMAGGVWAEGNDYSSQTQLHWVVAMLVNKEHRQIPVPNDYPLDGAKALNHMTLSGFTDVYRYGSGERVYNYSPIGDDSRYQYVLALQSLLTEQQIQQWITPWWREFIDKEGYPAGTIHPGMWRVLFEPLNDPMEMPLPPEETAKSTMHYASGVGLVSARSSWNDKASNIYMINRRLRLDHEHKDALSFDLAFDGRWITKEMSGYSGISTQSIAHNTLLIENAESGSSSPTGRASGDPYYYTVYDDQDVSVFSAEAAPAYNMSGYYATDYAKQVSRQITFIKPGIVAVYDRVVTDPSQFKDLLKYKKGFTWPQGSQYLRTVTLNQLIESEPQQLNENSHRYQFTTANAEVVYGVVEPIEIEVSVIDQKIKYKDYAEYHAPESQRKWQIQTKLSDKSSDNEFISYFVFTEAEQDDDEPKDPFLCDLYRLDQCPKKADHFSVTDFSVDALTSENSSILTGNAIGVAFSHPHRTPVTSIWNREPKTPLEHVQIQLKQLSGHKVIFSGLMANYAYRISTKAQRNETVLELVAQAPIDDAQEGNLDLYNTNDQGVLTVEL